MSEEAAALIRRILLPVVFATALPQPLRLRQQGFQRTYESASQCLFRGFRGIRTEYRTSRNDQVGLPLTAELGAKSQCSALRGASNDEDYRSLTMDAALASSSHHDGLMSHGPTLQPRICTRAGQG